MRWDGLGRCAVAQPACGGGLFALLACRDWCGPRESWAKKKKQARVFWQPFHVSICDMSLVRASTYYVFSKVVHIVLLGHACPVWNLYFHAGGFTITQSLSPALFFLAAQSLSPALVGNV